MHTPTLLRRTFTRVASVAAALSILVALGVTASGCGSKDVSAEAIPGPIQVRVVDRDTREPIEGVRAAWTGSEDHRRRVGTTDARGFVAWSHGAHGGVDVRLSDPAGRYLDEVVEVREPGSRIVELRRGSRATVAVSSAVGASIEPRVSVFSSLTPAGRTVSAADDGLPGPRRVEVARLAPGPAKLLLSAPGHVTQSLDVTISNGENDFGEVVLAEGGETLRGRLPADLAGRADEAFFRFDGAGVSVRVASDGSFAFEGLPRTRGVVVLRRAGKELFSVPVSTLAGPIDLGVVRPRA